jgi:hypothetical protein
MFLKLTSLASFNHSKLNPSIIGYKKSPAGAELPNFSIP